MDERQAFRKLGLEPHADEAEILARYHQLIASGRIQPDAMVEWESARDTALSAARRHASLPVEHASLPDQVEFRGTDPEGQWEDMGSLDDVPKGQAIDRLLAKHTQSLRTYRILAVALAGLFLALVLHGSGILSIFGSAIPRRSISVPIFSILAFMGAVYYWMFTSMTRSFQQDIRELDQTLRDAQGYAALLLDIIPHAARSSWTRGHLADALRRWTVRPPACGLPAPREFGAVQDFSKRIGHAEFADFLIRKGLEVRVIEKEITMLDDVDDGEDGEMVSYTLDYVPVAESTDGGDHAGSEGGFRDP